VTALALVKKGIPVTLIEAAPEPPEDQRAATIHPPTVEMLAELGLADEALAEDATGGLVSPLFHFRDRVSGELVAVFDLRLLGARCPIRSSCSGSNTSWCAPRSRTSRRAALPTCASPTG